MNEEELAQIEARLNAATPGPWTGEGAELWARGAEDFDWIPAVYHGRTTGQLKQQEHDAAFIAHARTDIPALLAEIRAAGAREAQLTEALARMSALVSDLVDLIAPAVLDDHARWKGASACHCGVCTAVREYLDERPDVQALLDPEEYGEYLEERRGQP